MTPPTKAPITTHILDQTTGRPAAGVRVHLYSMLADQSHTLHVSAHTDADGRIGTWTEMGPPTKGATEAESVDVNSVVAQHIADQMEVTAWKLVFETGEYFGGKTFWPRVELVVLIDSEDERGHWHVPLLLGPFGYTTYRGS